MGRKRIHENQAERQKRYRERQKAIAETLKGSPAVDADALRESIKQELKKSWEPELKAERIASERKLGRELARNADKSHSQGRIEGICSAAVFFIGRDRADITRALLSHFMIDRETAEAALQADKRTKSMTLASLDKAEAWKAPPPVIS